MNIATNTNTANFTIFDPSTFQGDLQDVRQAAAQSLSKALTMLGTLDSTGMLPSDPQATPLMPPKGLMMNAADLTLRIGLLQDALNQLMQQVSKTEIEGRLNDMNRENMEQLDKAKKQMEEVAESVKKQQEAAKKSNIFAAIANFFKAVFDFVSAIFTAIAAVGYALSGNVVAAAGLFVAAGALFASGICNMVLAVDSAIRAGGGKGFLSEQDIANLNKAVEICGYIAMAASMIGGLSVVVQGVRAGAAMAAKELAKHGLEAGQKAVMKEVMQAGTQAMKELMKMAVKETIDDVAKAAVREAVKEAMKAVLKPLVDMSMRTAVAGVLLKAPVQIGEGVVGVQVANLQMEAADAKRRADEAEAQGKAIQAMITMLRNLIEQLQADLEAMLESSMETVSAIFKAADDSASSMKELMNFQSA